MDAELLRPRIWVKSHGLKAGQLLPLNIAELQVAGLAHITAIEPCPTIATGEGSVITARFLTRQVDVIVRAEILGPDGTIEVIEGTPIHPIWSLDRLDWVPLSELEQGESLQSQYGIATVLSLAILRKAVPVYNVEVNGEHVFEVGSTAILVHNACQVDVVNIGEHALQSAHNWQKVLGAAKPTLHNIQPYVDDVIANGSWAKIGDAYGRGGKIVGEIFEASHNGIYIRGLKDLAGKFILNNAGVL